MKARLLALFGASLAVLGAASASAQVAYTNGPIDGTNSAWTINGGYAVTNSFTLSSTTKITGFTFGGWTDPGATFTAVDYGFSTSPDYAITGTASLTAGSVIPNTGWGLYDVRKYRASITPVTLAAGTYWFALQNGATTNNDYAYWDINNGPSTAYENVLGNVAGWVGPTSSTSFTLLSSAPEPASWAMMLGGFGLVGAAMRHRRKLAVSFS